MSTWFSAMAKLPTNTGEGSDVLSDCDEKIHSRSKRGHEPKGTMRDYLTEKTLVPVSLVVLVLGAAGGFHFWLSQKFEETTSRIEAKITNVSDDVYEIKTKMASDMHEFDSRIRDIEKSRVWNRGEMAEWLLKLKQENPMIEVPPLPSQ